MEPDTYRYGRVWRAVGVTAVLLAVALPCLMVANNETLDSATVWLLVGFASVGVWSYAYFAKYRLTMATEGFTIYRLGRQPFNVAWREVRSVRFEESEIRFVTTDQRRIGVSSYFPGYEALETAAARHLPDVVFETPEHRPLVEAAPVTPAEYRLQHLANRRFWLRLAYRGAAIGAVLCVIAFVADLALQHGNFREISRPLAIGLIYILSFARSWGYVMGGLFLMLGVLCLIMALQETIRMRKLPQQH